MEFSWKTDDGLDIYAKEWAVTNPKAVVCLVHGMGEHVNRYDHLAAFMNKNGLAMLGNDHRGHGKSGGKRGHFRKFDDYLNEVDTLIDEAQKRYPNKPIILWGHSKGGNIVLNYALRRNPKVKALIATGPWIELAFKPSTFMITLGKMMRNIYPALTQPSGLDANHVSSDKEVVKKYVADPLIHDKVSAETGMGMMDSGDWLANYEGYTSIPMLIMHGGDDKITSQPASEAFAKKLDGDVTYKKWDGLYHEIHNEKAYPEVFNYAWKWLSGKIG